MAKRKPSPEEREYLANLLSLLARRDEIVMAAHKAGFKQVEIVALSGLARTTVSRIVNRHG